MKSVKKYSALSVFALALAFGAGAAKADLDFVSNYYLNPVLGNPANELSWLEGEVGGELVYLGKANWNESTTFIDWEWGAVNTGLDAYLDGSGSGEVLWNVTGTGFELRYVLVKGGAIANPPGPPNHLYSLFEATPSQYLVSGEWESIFFGAPHGDRAISHVTFFGAQSSTTVPEPATLLLLGAGLIGVALLRRRRTDIVAKAA